jgi:hypothetical protein
MSEFLAHGEDSAMACPCCGYVDWKFLEDNVFLLVSKRGDGTRTELDEDVPGIVAAAFLCQRCRFIRLQAHDDESRPWAKAQRERG